MLYRPVLWQRRRCFSWRLSQTKGVCALVGHEGEKVKWQSRRRRRRGAQEEKKNTCSTNVPAGAAIIIWGVVVEGKFDVVSSHPLSVYCSSPAVYSDPCVCVCVCVCVCNTYIIVCWDDYGGTVLFSWNSTLLSSPMLIKEGWDQLSRCISPASTLPSSCPLCFSAFIFSLCASWPDLYLSSAFFVLLTFLHLLPPSSLFLSLRSVTPSFILSVGGRALFGKTPAGEFMERLLWLQTHTHIAFPFPF